MADPFLDDEASPQDNEARELYDITIGTNVYHHTSASRSVYVNGTLYTAEAIDRGPITVAQLRDGHDAVMVVKFRVDHPMVRRWFQQGVPPKTASAVVWRQQVRSGEVERIWTGEVASIDADDADHVANVTLTSLLGEPFRRRLPTVTVGRQCAHVLYGAGCNLVRTDSSPSQGHPYKCSTTVLYFDGRNVRLDLSNVPANASYRSKWLQFGELVHLVSGERMSIIDQQDLSPGVSTVTTVTMQLQIVGMKVGDIIETYAGCSHDAGTCYDKFSNQANFGGYASLPTRNPFFPTGLGVMEQA
jgi:hypothetical protein